MLSISRMHSSSGEISIRIYILRFPNSKSCICIRIIYITQLLVLFSIGCELVSDFLEFHKVLVVFLDVPVWIAVDLLELCKVDVVQVTPILHIIEQELLLLMDLKFVAFDLKGIFLFLQLIIYSSSNFLS